jgi:hypothetical protein
MSLNGERMKSLKMSQRWILTRKSSDAFVSLWGAKPLLS